MNLDNHDKLLGINFSWSQKIIEVLIKMVCSVVFLTGSCSFAFGLILCFNYKHIVSMNGMKLQYKEDVAHSGRNGMSRLWLLYFAWSFSTCTVSVNQDFIWASNSFLCLFTGAITMLRKLYLSHKKTSERKRTR